jgi:gluconolactonase
LKVDLLAEGLDFPEGPAFAPNGELWCVELMGGNLVRWSKQGLERFATGGAPNGLAFDRYGLAWFCDAEQCAIRTFNPTTRQYQTIADSIDGQTLFKPNDLAFDARGNLLFTCPGDSRSEPTGYVCCLSASGALTKIADQLFFPNGLALIDEGHELVVAETIQRRLWKGRWNAETCNWIERRPFAEVSAVPGPDGMALGADGLIYVAVFRSGQLQAYNAAGELIKSFDLPGKNPTNVAFDPTHRLGIVVTEAEKGSLLSLPDVGPGVKLFA